MAGILDSLLLRPLRSLLNTLLPFTDPKTPLAQDLTHAVALCAIFYYLPRFLERRHGSGRVGEEATEQGTRIDTDTRLREADPATAAENELEERNEDNVEDEIWEGDDADEGRWAQDENGEMHDLWNEEGVAGPAGDNGVADGEAGPADAPHAPPQPAAGAGRAARTNIGPKKARSLARRDQRRAYHEFQRQEAELRRQREAEGAEEREEAIIEEKRRRAVAEMLVEERLRAEREERRKAEEAERAREMARREDVLNKVRGTLDKKGCVDLEVVEPGAQKDWVRGLIRAGGLLGEKRNDGKREVRLLTSGGWVVRVDADLMAEAFRRAMEGRRAVSYEELGEILEEVVKDRASG